METTSPPDWDKINKTDHEDQIPIIGSNYLYLYLVLNVIQGISAIVLNSFVFRFYYDRLGDKNKNAIYFFLYVILAACDTITGVISLLHAILFGIVLNDIEKGIDEFLYTIHILSHISKNVSVFLNTLISTKRTIDIYKPVRKTKTDRILVFSAVFIYTTFWVVVAGLDVWSIVTQLVVASKWESVFLYVVVAPRIFSLYRLFNPHQGSRKSENIIYYAVISIGIPYIVPTIICGICAATQIYKLYTTRVSKGSTVNRRITITILLLTVTFYICNIPFWLYFVLNYRTHFLNSEFAKNLSEQLICYAIAHYTVILNAVVNPLILILRGKNLKDYTMDKLTAISIFSAPTTKNVEMCSAGNVKSSPWAHSDSKYSQQQL